MPQSALVFLFGDRKNWAAVDFNALRGIWIENFAAYRGVAALLMVTLHRLDRTLAERKRAALPPSKGSPEERGTSLSTDREEVQ